MNKKGLTASILVLIAVLSIGGLMFLGWLGEPSVTGELSYQSPYSVCCTVNPWTSASSGYRQGEDFTSTEICDPFELPQRCCMRAGINRFKGPVRLLDSRVGVCPGPELSYPVSTSDSYKSCCTVQEVRTAATGFIQGRLSTETEFCNRFEDPAACCARAGSTRLKASVRVIGSKYGECNPPELSYPAPIAGGYTACCSGSSWEYAPTGYAQGIAKTLTAYCDPVEKLSQCCARFLAQTADKPVRLLGFRLGSCSQPEKSYPVWIR